MNTLDVLSKEGFYTFLNRIPDSDKYWIACSGGLDSSVLLYLLFLNKKRIEQDIEVVYVNHQLQKKSDQWEVFCKQLCELYKLNFLSLRITTSCPLNYSVERWAREERYRLIKKNMNDRDILFTAHHIDDQVETFFLQALRGSGARGLAAMPVIKSFGKAYHIRPFLDCTRHSLKEYAVKHQLIWHEDPSNQKIRFDRNYFRNKISPIISSRWPSYRKSIKRLIHHQQEIKLLLDDIAEEDLKRVSNEETMGIYLNLIQKLSLPRKKNLIMFWIKKQNFNLPNAIHLNEIIKNIINSSICKVPCVNWHGVEVRRYRNMIYAIKPVRRSNSLKRYEWNLKRPLKLKYGFLYASIQKGNGLIKKQIKNDLVEIRYRQGGEKIQSPYQTITKTVKQIFQEKGILPWYRDLFPLIYINGELAAIPGICINQHFYPKNNEVAWHVEWSRYKTVVQ